MDNTKQFKARLIALMLFTALMFPSTVQFFHVLEGHEHTSCYDKTVHIHETSTGCDICDFQLVTTNYNILDYPDLVLPIISAEVTTNFVSQHSLSYDCSFKQLRAPPIYS